MELKVYQFLSNPSIANTSLGSIKTSPEDHPEIIFNIEFNVEDKPFETNFAQLLPSRPSIGASEYIDPHLDVFMARRWPKCIVGNATVDTPASTVVDLKLRVMCLQYMRVVCWYLPNHVQAIKEQRDQFASSRA